MWNTFYRLGVSPDTLSATLKRTRGRTAGSILTGVAGAVSEGYLPLLTPTPHPTSYKLRLPDSPVPVCRRRHAQLLLHITAEMRERREIHPIGNFLQRDVFFILYILLHHSFTLKVYAKVGKIHES